MVWFSRQAVATCVALAGLLVVVVVLAVNADQRSTTEWLALTAAGLVVAVLLWRWLGQAVVWVSRGCCCRPLRRALDRREIDHVTAAHAPLSRFVPDHRVVVVPFEGRELWLLPSLDAHGTLRRGRELARELGVEFMPPELIDPEH